MMLKFLKNCSFPWKTFEDEYVFVSVFENQNVWCVFRRNIYYYLQRADSIMELLIKTGLHGLF